MKGNGSKAASSPATEPNFYTMPPCRETVLHRVLSEDIEQCDDFAIIEDTNTTREDRDDDDDDVIRLPMDIESPDETPRTPSAEEPQPSLTTPPPSPRDRSESFNSVPPPITTSSSSCLPIVSPLESRTLIVSPLNSQVLSSLSIPLEMKLEEVHSGDQMFFEGLPFHYLETKDVEDSLLVEH